MTKSVIDGALITALVGALFYFAGLLYYFAFFYLLGLPLVEFLPFGPLVTGKSGLILIELISPATWYIVFVAVATMLIRIFRHYSARCTILTKRLQRLLRPIVGWPLILIPCLVYLAFLLYIERLAHQDAEKLWAGTDSRLPRVAVYFKSTTAGIHNPLVGKLVADSSVSYAILPKDGPALIVHKEDVSKIEASLDILHFKH